MGAVMLLGCALASAFGCWLAAGEDVPAAVGRIRAKRAWAELRARLGVLGRARPLAWAGGSGPWAEAARELARDARVIALGLGHEELLGAFALGVCMVGLAALVISRSFVGFVVGAAFACVLPRAWAARRARARGLALAREVPDVFRSLASAMAAGRTLSQAISYVASVGTGPLQQEFARASLQISCGEPATAAIEGLARRASAPGMGLMVCALSVSARTGAPLQGLFLRSASLVERRFELERELMAKTAQVRLSARVVSALPVCMVAALSVLSPDFRQGLTTAVGLGCVCVAACLDVVALLAIRILMRGVM